LEDQFRSKSQLMKYFKPVFV